ncbi:MAG: alpha-ketoacid dehydrogenase subunit beta [Candidatus Kariarchaeaceae archaeon]|jgi:pyruvate dehydrogenase E1 component beta subunit
MKEMDFAEAIEDVILQAMSKDESILILGEDVHGFRLNLFTQFGESRVKSTPISEGAFVGAAVTAAMSGLRPIVEVMLVDFLAVAMDAILNHAAKTYFFSGKHWNVPLVLRVSCGGGYGDGGQHEQSLWGWLAHIPGISVVVPSNPADAGGLMLTAIESDHPVIFLEHKLLADYWLEAMGIGGRDTVQFDVPPEGVRGKVPDVWKSIPLGKLRTWREGSDITLVSVGVGVHRCLEAAIILEKDSISVEVLDLRSIAPMDREGIIQSVKKTKNVIVVDEDYKEFGLSGEISAILLENGMEFKYGRVCTEGTIPFARHLEDQILPNTERIVQKCKDLLSK